MKKVRFIIIAAVSVDGVIGIDNEIPWQIPEDFKHFRKITINNMLLVGYNTYKTLPEIAFEKREYLVLMGDNPITDHNDNKVYQFKDLNTILGLFNNETNIEKVFVAGGAMVYESLIDYCDKAIITWVDKIIPNGNKRFPIDKLFTNFEIYHEQEWQTSKTGERYKVAYYRKK